ncbi:MAG: DEAD/DEAH box helicase [Alphaproteobacteria bacterium]
MGLNPRLIAKLTQMQITEPTPIQAQAIPVAMEGRDVMGLAQTGTGKTAAFAVPLIQSLEASGGRPFPKTARSLILAPTRELANQIADALASFAGGANLKVTVVVGGASIHPQIKRLGRGVDILVATPGRLMDLLERGAVDLSQSHHLVLDEADQMLDMGFIHALRQIAPLLPDDRQTMLFSATMPKQMAELARAFLKDPVRIETAPPGTAAENITQSVHYIAQGQKTALLIDLLNQHKDQLALVFARTRHGTERLMHQLGQAGFATDSIHGDKRQRERERTIRDFREGRIRVLVATDVAARGIDISDVRYVYNYDLPNVAENYVHRIGRTARAGAEGNAVSFCAAHEMAELRGMQKAVNHAIVVAGGDEWRTGRPPQGKRPQQKRPQQGRPWGGPNRGEKPNNGGHGQKPRSRRAA